MLWTKIKVVTACAVLVVGALGVGGVLGRQTAGPAADSPAAQAEPPRQAEAAQPPDKAPPANRVADKPPEKEDKPPEKAKAKPPEKAKPAEKRYSFSMNQQPWAEVFDWLSAQTGLGFVSPFRPTGTFTFSPPVVDGAVKQYTISEVFDILNEALQAGNPKYLLVRRDKTFGLLAPDEKIDPTLVPRVEVSDLGKRGKRELVRVVVPLMTLPARDLAPDVKKMLGPFGEVVALDKANQLLVLDTAGNLLEILQMAQDAEIREAIKQREAKDK